MGEAAGDITYKSTAVSEINKFHNLFVGQSEKLGAVDNVAYVARGTSGVVLANCDGNEKSVSISGTGLANGTYTDTVSGAKFTVANGVLTGNIGSTGVAVVYNGTTTPRNTCSVESGDFKGDTITLNLGLDNATSGTYCIDNSKPVAYTGDIAIRVGSDYAYGETINLTLTATDGKIQQPLLTNTPSRNLQVQVCMYSLLLKKEKQAQNGKLLTMFTSMTRNLQRKKLIRHQTGLVQR